jgi:hypothetical protein
MLGKNILFYLSLMVGFLFLKMVSSGHVEQPLDDKVVLLSRKSILFENFMS